MRAFTEELGQLAVDVDTEFPFIPWDSSRIRYDLYVGSEYNPLSGKWQAQAYDEAGAELIEAEGDSKVESLAMLEELVAADEIARRARSPYQTRSRSGEIVHYDHPHHNDFCLQDIAVGLSRAPRFSGQTVPDEKFSVAQHSLLVARLISHVNRDLILAALLHDASEAYLGDLPSPFKAMLPDYKRVEAKFMAAIEYRFGLPSGACSSKEIKRADRLALVIENRVLRPGIELTETDVPSIPVDAEAFMANFDLVKEQTVAFVFAQMVQEELRKRRRMAAA